MSDTQSTPERRNSQEDELRRRRVSLRGKIKRREERMMEDRAVIYRYREELRREQAAASNAQLEGRIAQLQRFVER